MSRKDNDHDHSHRFSTTVGGLVKKNTADFEEGGVIG